MDQVHKVVLNVSICVYFLPQLESITPHGIMIACIHFLCQPYSYNRMF